MDYNETTYLPLVSVPVITYNSSKTVIETLDSIYNQTYPRIELIVSDDCSTDDTVDVCKMWIESHANRFEHTKILTADKNTGISKNNNRAIAATQGEWIKCVAGDDKLRPQCVQKCVEYVRLHPDSIYVFGRQKSFGADDSNCETIDAKFDYSMFSKSLEEQLNKLLFEENFVPATTMFFNKKRVEELNIKFDERIPILEDWPMWINLLRSGVKLHFVDEILVDYRVGGISTSNYISLNFYRAERLFHYYYQYPAWLDKDEEYAIQRAVDEDCQFYQMCIDADKRYQQVVHSVAYRLGRFLLAPFKWFKK